MTNKLRVGIVGLGNAGMMHVRSLSDGSLPRGVLTAASDVKAKVDSLRTSMPGHVKLFDSYDDMLASGCCDAVIIATPHLQHPELSIKALKAGLHVFCEKPAGVSVGAVREMNAVAEASGKVFSIHFNRRLEPVFQKLRSLLRSNELGEIYRILWETTDWYRPDCYFASAAWRGTWAGEGGGVLINQGIHHLDIWQHLFGLPGRVRSFCRFGKHHAIEVEDEVTAFVEYGNGVTGTFIASTGESPGTNRLEIACSRGRLIVEDKTIRFHRLTIPLDEFNRKTTEGFAEPANWVCEIPVAGLADLSGGMLRNFLDSALDGTALLVDGTEGLASLEFENAILLSTWLDNWVELPVDAAAFDRELRKRAAASKKKVMAGAERTFDLKASFK